MRKLLLALSMLVIVSNLYSQDLIITNDGDTLNCKITSDKGDYLRFNYMYEDDFRKTLIAKSDVKAYAFNHFAESEITKEFKQKKSDYQHFRLSANGGFSYRTGRISSDLSGEMEDYMKELKWGKHFSADASWFISESLGFGVKYSRFMSSNSLLNVSADIDGNGLLDYGNIKDNISISFVGPMVSTVFNSYNKKNAFFGSWGLGYLSYHDNGEMVGSEAELNGSTLGMVGDLGYQIGISENLSLAITFSYTLGVLSKIDQTLQGQTRTYKLDDDNKENLGRLDLSLGLVFHK